MPLAVINFCNILGLRAALRWLPIAIAVRPVSESIKTKNEMGLPIEQTGPGSGGRTLRLVGDEGSFSPPGAVARTVGVGVRVYGGHNLSDGRNRVQLIACTSIIDAVHTARPRWHVGLTNLG